MEQILRDLAEELKNTNIHINTSMNNSLRSLETLNVLEKIENQLKTNIADVLLSLGDEKVVVDQVKLYQGAMSVVLGIRKYAQKLEEEV